MTKEQAETVALQALAHIAGSDTHLRRFLAVSGLAPEELRARAADPALLAAVLDYVLVDDRLVVEIAEACGLAPEAPRQARAKLPNPPAEW